MNVHRNVRLLAWFNFFNDFRPYGPIAILYFAQVSGSFALGMSVFSATMLASSIFEVPTGVFSDRIGRKWTAVLGAAASLAALTLYAAAGTYAGLIAGAILEGLSRAFFSGNNDALLHDSLEEAGAVERFQEMLGKTSSMYQFALALSAVLGSVILAWASFGAVMWVSVIPHALGLIVALMMVEPKVHHAREGNIYAHLATAFRNIVRNPRLRTISAASVIGYALGESGFQFRSAFIETLWPVWAIGIVRMVAHVLAAVSFYLAGKIIRRFGEFTLLVGGISLSEFVNLVGLLAASVISPALMALNSIFFGVNMVATGSLMQREFTPAERATMGSLTAFAGSLTFSVVSFALGALADAVGARNALIVLTLLTVIPVALYWRVFRKHAPGKEVLSTEKIRAPRLED